MDAEGHGTHIAKARFTADDQRVLTIGGFNRSIIQYKLTVLGVDSNGIGVPVDGAMHDANAPPPPPGKGGLEEKEELEEKK